jgi:hypothetical protein
MKCFLPLAIEVGRVGMSPERLGRVAMVYVLVAVIIAVLGA